MSISAEMNSSYQNLSCYNELLAKAKDYGKSDIYSAFYLLCSSLTKSKLQNIYNIDEEKLLKLLSFSDVYCENDDYISIIIKGGSKYIFKCQDGLIELQHGPY